MNKAITDGVLLMPPAFANGLDVWSRGDGTPGTDTYDVQPNAAFVPADADFGGCLELQKIDATQKVRYMGETPLLPGCYLRITARVKAISGNFPSVRIAAFAGGAGGTAVPGVVDTGPSVALSSYGEVVEVSAIVGAGNRNGVDMVWGPDALYGHFGLDLTGQNGGIVRIDDVIIEDITSAFLRDLVATVDVRDYGAIGDGVTDDSQAFDAANAAANGRTILVPEGVFRLESDVTFDSPAQFEGVLSMPTEAMLLLRRNFDFPNYLEAFEDETLAFQKGFQALLNNSDHESFDLGGRKITIENEIDMQAAVPNRTSYTTRRVLRNGQLDAQGSNWDDEVVTSQGTYATTNATRLTNVTNVANVPVGALVEGTGVGREVYVRSKNVAAQEVTLSAPLFDGVGTQVFTFTRFKYILNFNGFSLLSKFILDSIEIQCNARCSGILLAPSGSTFQMHDCFISRPKDRGISSNGEGCQGMLIDRCQFLSSEEPLEVSQRKSIVLNVNANDLKLRNNRATRFRHFALIAGQNNLIMGNHFFQGDEMPGGIRTAGLIIATTHTSSIVSDNYVDNCFIEWTNEHDPAPEQVGEFSFSSLTITDNVFLSGDVAPWFNYIVVKPHGAGHFLNGVNIANNRFRSINGKITRVEGIDTSFSDLDNSQHRDVTVQGNSFHNIEETIATPLRIRHAENSESTSWTIDAGLNLPFQGRAMGCDGVVLLGDVTNASDEQVFQSPHVDLQQGTDRDQVVLTWGEALKGEVQITVRMDR